MDSFKASSETLCPIKIILIYLIFLPSEIEIVAGGF